MALRVYNTLSAQKEDFKPFSEDGVTMYVCGPTVYDSSHIGHAMSAIVFDVIRRYLEFKGYNVKYAMNFTDVDDKIINRANEEKIEWRALTERYIEEYKTGIQALNVKLANLYPRATQEIAHIVSAIQELIEKGAAYPTESGDVNFRVLKAQDYGALKHQNLDELRAGERIEIDPDKENPLDFALWKAAKPGEPSWDSPWGSGRPGWHIECSAMVLEHLGVQIDIHGGGSDLIFPHHSNEIAQSESLTGKRPFVKYWMHNGLLNFGGDKMSKSLKNFVTMQQILQKGDPDTLRMLVLNGVYRNPLTYTEESFEAAARGLQRLKATTALQIVDPNSPQSNLEAEQLLQQETEKAYSAFIEAMDDDFNTSKALAVIFDYIKAINKARDASVSASILQDAQKKLGDLAEILGIRPYHIYIQGVAIPSSEAFGVHSISVSPSDKAPFVQILTEIASELDKLNQHSLANEVKKRQAESKEASSTVPLIEALVLTRLELRMVKQFGLADKVRNNLKEQGILLEDRPNGTVWKWGSYQSDIISKKTDN